LGLRVSQRLDYNRRTIHRTAAATVGLGSRHQPNATRQHLPTVRREHHEGVREDSDVDCEHPRSPTQRRRVGGHASGDPLKRAHDQYRANRIGCNSCITTPLAGPNLPRSTHVFLILLRRTFSSTVSSLGREFPISSLFRHPIIQQYPGT
jgi:hypothetical protein